MSLLMLLGGGVKAPVEPPPDPDPVDTLASDPDATLYAIPSSSPYNTPTRIVTPTYDGTGEAIHPSVIDFHQRIGTNWRGWRYWMLMTPYTDADATVENPSILVSNNGFYWQVPAGVTNPLFWPTPGTSNPVLSDTHLEYDPETDGLVALWRDNGRDFVHITARSSNGTTWPASGTDLDIDFDGEEQAPSPAICKVAPGDWRMFAVLKDSRNIAMWRASSPEGPWSLPNVCIGIAGNSAWHLDVQYHDGKFTALIDRGPIGSPDGFQVSSSVDGLLWAQNNTNVMNARTDPDWDSRQLYRACHTPHENGTHYRVWYSASRLLPAGHPSGNTSEWGIGYTHLPASLWPTPPVATPGSGTTYQTLALSHGSALMWRLGGDPLNPAAEPDSSGNGRTGTYLGTYVRETSLTGDAGYASRLSAGYIWRVHESWMNSAAFTVRAVVRMVSSSGVRAIASHYGPDGGWVLKTSGTSLVFESSYGGTITKTSAVSNNSTYHVAVTVASDGTATLYLNGTAVGTSAVTMNARTATSRFAVGGRWTGSAWTDNWTSTVEYVDFCPTALTAAQIAASSTEALT